MKFIEKRSFYKNHEGDSVKLSSLVQACMLFCNLECQRSLLIDFCKHEFQKNKRENWNRAYRSAKRPSWQYEQAMYAMLNL